MAEWQRILNTTIHQYIKDVEDNIMRNRKILAMLQDRGRVTFNNSGDLMDWKVKYKKSPLRTITDGDTLTFSKVNRYKTAQLDWRGYAVTDALGKFEKLKNQGTAEGIIKLASDIVNSMVFEIEDSFGDEIYADGNAAGGTGRIHGLESWFGTSGPSPHGFVGLPSDTYAGLLTNLGNYGGSWSKDASSNTAWPDGTGDVEYSFWSPLVVDYTDTAWTLPSGVSGYTWANTCTQAIRYAITKSHKNKSKRGMLDMIILESEMYRLVLEQQAVKERLTVVRGDKKGGLYALGFEDSVNVDGVDITSEYGIPDGVGYGLNVDELELRSLQSQLFVPEVPDFDLASYTERFSIDFFGNMRCNPRYQAKFVALT